MSLFSTSSLIWAALFSPLLGGIFGMLQIVENPAVRFQSSYTKDERAVYYRGEMLPDADPDTFAIFDAFYAKDKDNVYYEPEPFESSSRVIRLEGADPKTFALCDADQDRDDCAKDAKSVYVLGRLVQGADPETFTMLSDTYGKDTHSVYTFPYEDEGDGYARVIPGADPETFAALRWAKAYDARDKVHVYLKGTLVK